MASLNKVSGTRASGKWSKLIRAFFNHEKLFWIQSSCFGSNIFTFLVPKFLFWFQSFYFGSKVSSLVPKLKIWLHLVPEIKQTSFYLQIFFTLEDPAHEYCGTLSISLSSHSIRFLTEEAIKMSNLCQIPVQSALI